MPSELLAPHRYADSVASPENDAPALTIILVLVAAGGVAPLVKILRMFLQLPTQALEVVRKQCRIAAVFCHRLLRLG